MIQDRFPMPDVGKVSLLLLDPRRGEPVQAWEFEGQAIIKIGRSPDNDIVIPDARVSRLHAELQFLDNQWQLVNRGQNGILLSGKTIDRAPLQHENCFRLGLQGPSFRFQGICEQEPMDPCATIMDTRRQISIQIDHEQKARDVQGILESDYFKQLHQVSKELKNRQPKPSSKAPD
ncbi:MAG TPA: FHA domain-containing protein [Terriglobales bacterium]|nr:FHA domain-containing protein [Terriglobales bacterium]